MRFLQDLIMKGVRNLTHDMQTQITRRVAYEVRRIQRRIITTGISLFLLALACVFIAAGTVYLGVEYLALTKTLAFLIVGVLLLVIGVVIKLID